MDHVDFLIEQDLTKGDHYSLQPEATVQPADVPTFTDLTQLTN